MGRLTPRPGPLGLWFVRDDDTGRYTDGRGREGGIAWDRDHGRRDGPQPDKSGHGGPRLEPLPREGRTPLKRRRLKLVINNWITGLLGVLAETISFARATGVDPQAFLDAIEGGPLGVPYAQMKGKMMIEENFPTSFSTKLARKDAGLVLEAAEARALRMTLASAVAARFDEAIKAGYDEKDMAAIYEAVERKRK